VGNHDDGCLLRASQMAEQIHHAVHRLGNGHGSFCTPGSRSDGHGLDN
jgi:hypothetical protein